jgi:outer membrane protein TolC
MHGGAANLDECMTPASKNHAPPVAVALASLFMAGCAVGPNFKKPAAPDVSDYTAAPLTSTASANVAGGQAQRFARGADITADWWTLFHSKPLNDLIEQSLASNPDLKAAHAALSVARENVLAQRGVYYPNASASFAASRQRQSGQISPTLNSNIFVYDLFTPQVSVSYVPDVFGLNRRTDPPADRRQLQHAANPEISI